MDVDFLAIFEGAKGAFLPGYGPGGASDLDVDLGGGRCGCSSDEEVASGDSFFSFGRKGKVGEVEGGAHAGAGFAKGGGMALDGADVGAESGGIGCEGIASLDASAGEGAGDDGADAFGRKCAVDRETGLSVVAGLGGVPENLGEGGFELIHAEPSGGGDGADGGLFKGGSLEVIGEHFFDEVDVLAEVGLGECDDEITDPEVGKDLKVFFGLGHPGVIGGDDEDGEVDGSNAGDHVVDEVGVAGDIDDADLEGVVSGRSGEREVSEAELDGDAALLFFGEAVRVSARESLDEGGFSMADVTGGSDNIVAGHLGGKF